jgi:hypothetical protein
MTPEPKLENKWSVIENVFELLETDQRKLTAGEKQLIAGQRHINATFYAAIDAILGTFPDETAPQAIKGVKKMLVGLPGSEPPGCQLIEETKKQA